MNITLPQTLMRSLGIAGVFLFGSEAQGVAGTNSDVDIAVLLEDPCILRNRPERNRLYDALYDAIAPQLGRPRTIDIVFLQDVDLQLRTHVARDGKLLYAGDRKRIGAFLEHTMEEAADFAPFRREFHSAILARASSV